LAEWIGKLADRLLRFKEQLRFGIIELISASVAETIEDNLHRPFERNSPPQELVDESWHPPYLTNERMQYTDQERPIQRSEAPSEFPYEIRTQGWRTTFALGMRSLWGWLQGSWAEPILLSGLAFISLLLFIR
jgi:hypothetical protein